MHDSHATYFCVPEAILKKMASLFLRMSIPIWPADHCTGVIKQAALKLTAVSLFCKQFHNLLRKKSKCQAENSSRRTQRVVGPWSSLLHIFKVLKRNFRALIKFILALFGHGITFLLLLTLITTFHQFIAHCLEDFLFHQTYSEKQDNHI